MQKARLIMQISQTINRVIAVHAVLFFHLTNIFNTIWHYMEQIWIFFFFREEGDLSNSLQSKPAYAWNQLQHLPSLKNQLIWLLQETLGGHRPDLEILVTFRAWSFVQTHIHLVTSSTFLSMQVPSIWTPFAKHSLWKRSDLKWPHSIRSNHVQSLLDWGWYRVLKQVYVILKMMNSGSCEWEERFHTLNKFISLVILSVDVSTPP